MRHLIGRVCLVVSLSAVLITAACSTVLNEAGLVAPAAQPDSGAELAAEPEPPPAVEPESTPVAGPESAPPAEAEPTPLAEPPAETPATELRMEIGEPVEGVVPASPVAPQEEEVEEETDMPAALRAQSSPQGEEPLAAAFNDLVAQTGLSPDQINLVSMEPVEWSDTSLGCPEEGYMYAQVITPGFRIILEAEGVQYEYHTDEETNVVLCQP